MRLGYACLVATAGCNAIWGSHDVQESPPVDALPADAAPYPLQVSGMNFDSSPAVLQGIPVGTIIPTFPALSGLSVEAGAVGASQLQPLTLTGDGHFAIPFDLAQQPYRLVYHPPDGVPVEIQEMLQAAHFVVPTLGRTDGMPSPGNAMMADVLPPMQPTGYQELKVFSIGEFAVCMYRSMVMGVGSGHEWRDNSTMLDPVYAPSGAIDAPVGSKGDRVVAVDADPSSNTANGFTVGTMEGFLANGLADMTWTPWATTSTKSVDKLNFQVMSSILLGQRLDATIGNAGTPDNAGNPYIYGGVVPSETMPGFIGAGAANAMLSGSTPKYFFTDRGYGGLDVPAFLPMVKTVTVKPSVIRAFDGVGLPQFPLAMFARFSRSRVAEGITFTEGIESILTKMENTTSPVDLPLTVGIASTASQKLTLAGVTIVGGSVAVGVAAPAGMKPLELAYNVDGPVDDCVATLYRIDTGALTPVRRFLSTQAPSTKPIEVDPATFDTTHHYVFGIACHLGLPGVKKTATQTGGDWSVVSYPFQESMLYSQPFFVTDSV